MSNINIVYRFSYEEYEITRDILTTWPTYSNLCDIYPVDLFISLILYFCLPAPTFVEIQKLYKIETVKKIEKYIN